MPAFIDQVLAAELAATPEALVIPFGGAASQAVDRALQAADLPAGRALRGFPHPSGANGHRKRQFEANRDRLSQAVTDWAARLQ